MTDSTGASRPDKRARSRLDPALGKALSSAFGPDLRGLPDRVREALEGRGSGDNFQFVDLIINLICDSEVLVSDSACTLLDLWRRSFSNKDAELLQSVIPRLLDASTGPATPPQVKINAVSALARLGSPIILDSAVIAVAVGVLIDLIQVSNHRPDIMEAAILLLPLFGHDAATAAVGTLIQALSCQSADVKVAACSTLGRLKSDAGAAVGPLVTTAVTDEDPDVVQAAVESLGMIDPEGQGVANEIHNSTLLDVLIEKLRFSGVNARSLRRNLERARSGRMGARTSPIPIAAGPASGVKKGRVVASESTSLSGDFRATKPNFKTWAIGIESDNIWHVFKKTGDEWRHRGHLTGIRKGQQQSLLEAFAKGGGFLSRDAALRTLGGAAGQKEARGKVLNAVKSNLTYIRNRIRDSIYDTDTGKSDPLPWTGGSGAAGSGAGWRAEVEIGYAIMSDGYTDGDRKLRFKLADELTGDERSDRKS